MTSELRIQYKKRYLCSIIFSQLKSKFTQLHLLKCLCKFDHFRRYKRKRNGLCFFMKHPVCLFFFSFILCCHLKLLADYQMVEQRAQLFILWLSLALRPSAFINQADNWCSSIGSKNGGPRLQENVWTDNQHYVCQYNCE